MTETITRIEVTPQTSREMRDVRGDLLRRRLESDHNCEVTTIRSIMGYLIKSNISSDKIENKVEDIFSDPIIEHAFTNQNALSNQELFPEEPDAVVSIGFKPGVTDNPGTAALDGFKTIFPNTSIESDISTYTTYAFYGLPNGFSASELAAKLHNPLIEKAEFSNHGEENPTINYPELPPLIFEEPATINLEVSDEELIRISEEGLLALNLEEMKTIQAHYRNSDTQSIRTAHGLPPDAPTDVELESLAQTWSEHCKHKIFAAKIHHIDLETGEDCEINSLFKTYIMKPTLDMQEEVDWLLSIFHDNSGVIAWDEDWSLCMKAETHNSPSALDPYGGAMTGIVGVNRDILGTGLGARPIANTDVFCFGPPDWEGELPENLFHPSRVLRGVHSGVKVGGNESGIPTVNGAMVFDDRYIGKPLVYCGTVGIMPRTLPDGRPSHIKTPREGDIVYMVGGRVGRDGIHGATFSSLELTEDSPSSAVQIGDPITQKKMLDMILEARDAGLMSCITDNGAGGLSSSIGEMAEYTNGCEIDLEAVPLKQAGLSPWEILVSESQERMTVSVRSDDIAAFETLAALHEVEATKVARFTSDGDFHVKFGKKTVGLLPLEFFHNGVPQLNLESEWKTPTLEPFSPPKDINHSNILLEMLARPNIASKETWVRQYDHEVIAQTAVKPFVGVENDGPGNSGVLAPIHGNPHGFVVSNGIVPRYSDIDAGAMAEAAVDEALRNAVCSGVNLDRIAGLDNFCWPDPIESTKTPDGKFKLAQLVRANRQLEMACRAYRLPCISGKDSMKNDYGKGKDKISIPPTLLFSLIGDKVDVRNIATSDFKPGERIHLVGKSLQELGASEVTYHLGSNIGGDVPRLHNPESNLEMYRSLTSCINNGVVITAHDCSDGGLAVAIAEMCIGGRCGASIDIDGPGDTDEWGKLWGESLARIVIGVSPDKEEEFLKTMSQHPTTYLGEVTENNTLEIYNGDEKLVNLQIEEMVTSWKGTLDMTGGVE